MAGPWTKSSPLETYLNTVAPVNTDAEAAERSKSLETPSKPMDKNWEEGARAVILTILNNIPVLSDSELRERSEFAPALYDHMVSDLTGHGLVETAPDGYRLTESGKLAAKRERDRLLGML